MGNEPKKPETEPHEETSPDDAGRWAARELAAAGIVAPKPPKDDETSQG
jgi:hypothetical protein